MWKIYLILVCAVLFAIIKTGIELEDTGRTIITNNSTNNMLAMIDEDSDILAVKSRNAAVRKRLLANAKGMIGMSYRLGGIGDGNVDCSGLIYAVCRLSGVPIPRASTKIMAMWTRVDDPDIADLPLFAHSSRISHVGIWHKPETEMVHASSSKGVEKRDIDSQGGYWRSRYKYSVIIPSLEY